MKTRILMLTVVSLITGFSLSGCSWFKKDPPAPQMYETAFAPQQGSIPVFRIKDRNDVREVIALARSLSSAGRYKESAEIYLDAAKRFKSSSGNFKIDCKMAAVREYWLAGNPAKARQLLDELEDEQDIYNRASEADDIRRLRAMLRESENLNKQAVAANSN
ncbi:MAG: hypothetical protein PHV82_06270 [Victivallaceae bacterium]|nr:hypothetical protein [Victivallaceae bacterium]